MKLDENQQQQQQHELLQLSLKSQEDLNAKLKFLTSQQTLNLSESIIPLKDQRQALEDNNEETEYENSRDNDDEDDEAAKNETNSNLDDNNIEAEAHQFEDEEEEEMDSNESSQTSSSNSASYDNDCKKSQSIKSGNSSQHLNLDDKEQNDEENR